ncbi:hypothetical protein MLD38_007341 [Melastoma candidum]|uniref:Uncharacterized protein n=1 Tax=Melastoma candidum TaxID=119954 RepID=A0ACB9RQY9_9MYRT|nr:hypothetical protein MLD38_007341 [Melastoma candidum]
MDSNFLMNSHHQPQDGVPRTTGDCSVPLLGQGGLARYHSAPTSCLSDFDFLSRPSSPETERILQRFISGTAESVERAVQSGNGELPMPMKREETGEGYVEQGRYSSHVSRDVAMGYMVAGGGTEATKVVPMKGGYVPSRLARHSSSPAGLFDDINIDGQKASRFNGTMSPIHEIGRKNMIEARANSSSYLPGFPISSLDDLMNPGDLFSKRQRGGDADVDALSGQIAEELEEEEKRRTWRLAHHLSLPPKKKKKSADTTGMAVEGFLQLQQESVPCKVRAKRGCATHPRSIAERVRRTKISERIRKLQELVPNMDKQTNTADMLDLAVEYIKELQGRVKALTENQARCTCSNSNFS